MTPRTTTNKGIPVSSDDESLIAGTQGPILLHDRYRIGPIYAQLPVNPAKAAVVKTYSEEGAMAYSYNGPQVPVHTPNSFDGPHADPEAAGDEGLWPFDGQAVRAGYIEREEDGVFVKADILYREVLKDAERDRLVSDIVGHVSDGVREPVFHALRPLEERRS
jgi:catalase